MHDYHVVHDVRDHVHDVYDRDRDRDIQLATDNPPDRQKKRLKGFVGTEGKHRAGRFHYWLHLSGRFRLSNTYFPAPRLRNSS